MATDKQHKELRQRIQAAMEALGIYVDDLAFQIGMHPEPLQLWLDGSGKLPPGVVTQACLAVGLEAPLERTALPDEPFAEL